MQLEAIPHAVAMVRAADKKSPREAIEFVLQLLKYNDNNGNPYSDVFWLAALVQSVGELEFGQQSILLLSSLLKRIDRLLQFDSLMPSYNGILTISCIRTLTQIALKLSGFIPLDRVYELVKPFRDLKALWQVRIEASRALLDIEFHCKGMDSALLLFIKYIEEEHSLRGQLKLATHVMRLCQMRDGLNSNDEITSQTLVSMLNLLEGRMAFNNAFLRHYLFCILQILARRPPTLHGIPRENRTLHMSLTEACNYQKNMFVLDTESKPLDLPSSTQNLPQNLGPTEGLRDALDEALKDRACESPTQVHVEALKEAPLETPKEVFTEFPQEAPIEAPNEVSKEADTVSNSHERKRPIKIKVKQSSATSRADTDNQVVERSLGGRNEMDHGASSSVSVDAPQRNFAETLSISNHNIDEANSWHDRGSRMTASIGSAKFLSDGDELVKELQCTADSSIVYSQPQPEDPSSSSIIQDNNIDADARRYASLQTLSVARFDPDGESLGKEISARGKEKHKSKEKKRKRDRDSNRGHQNDPEYLERKRLKKEKKRREKEMAKLQSDEAKRSSVDLSSKKEAPVVDVARQLKSIEPTGFNSKLEIRKIETKPEPSEGTSGAPKIRIKIKNRMLNKS
ncbi:Transcription initiation factor TFIID subunit 2, partial [Mucuna pruriens]